MKSEVHVVLKMFEDSDKEAKALILRDEQQQADIAKQQGETNKVLSNVATSLGALLGLMTQHFQQKASAQNE
jgi:hypothetical protein